MRTYLQKRAISVIGLSLSCLLVLGNLCGCGSSEGDKTTDSTSTTESGASQADESQQSDAAAAALAASAAGLASTAPAGYWYADTSSITAPLKSFGLHSEQANQKLLFILFDDTIPIDDLNAYVDEPPYTNLVKVKQLDEGDRQLGAVQMQWVSCEYKPGKSHKKFKGTDLLDDKDHRPEKEPVLVASFPAVEKGKSILIVGQSYAPDKVFEKDDALFILDSLVDKSKQPAGATSDADSSSTFEDKNATDGKTGEAAETSSQPDDKSTADKQAGDGANQGKDSH